MTVLSETLLERGGRYGSFEVVSRTSQGIKTCMKHTPNWQRLSDSQKESLEMIASKIARILNGDPNYKDSWFDISGYATLAMETIDEPATSLSL